MTEHKIINVELHWDDRNMVLWAFVITESKIFKIPMNFCAIDVMKETSPALGEKLLKILSKKEFPAEKELREAFIGETISMPDEAGITRH